MTGNKPSTATGWTDPDDALSAPEHQAKLAAAPVRRGRPKSASPKVRIGFRLSAELVERIRASGPGYNSRVEKVLREGFFGPKTPPKSKRA
ncbi:MAG TPA: BrnA antitoxin family protein [Roseiarcus sp.]|nr:BrnA antitoxin family protein [Roseiarcus sp.]